MLDVTNLGQRGTACARVPHVARSASSSPHLSSCARNSAGSSGKWIDPSEVVARITSLTTPGPVPCVGCVPHSDKSDKRELSEKREAEGAKYVRNFNAPKGHQFTGRA